MKHGITFFQSFRCACSGILSSIRSERNFRIHIVVFLYVFLFAILFYQLDALEYALLICCSTVVLVCELLNTAIEIVVDALSPEYSLFAKLAKDIAAGAVLVSAGGAVVIGVLVLWNPTVFRLILDTFFSSPLLLGILLGSILVSILFIWKGDKLLKRKCTSLPKSDYD